MPGALCSSNICTNKALIVGLMTWFQYKYISPDWNVACCACRHTLSTFFIFFTPHFISISMRMQTQCRALLRIGEIPINFMDFRRSKYNLAMGNMSKWTDERFDSTDAFPVKWASNNRTLIINTRRMLYENDDCKELLAEKSIGFRFFD